jgi:hypothetical protein
MYVKVIYNLRDCRNWTQPDLTHRQNIYSMAGGIFRVMAIKELFESLLCTWDSEAKRWT